MAVAAANVAHKRWTSAEVEDVVIGLLAGLLGKDSRKMRQELAASGAHLPVDSLDLFDVLVEFRQATGISLPKRKLTRAVMRSVRAFAQFAATEGQGE